MTGVLVVLRGVIHGVGAESPHPDGASAVSAISFLLCALGRDVYAIVEPVVATGNIAKLGFLHWPAEAALGF